MTLWMPKASLPAAAPQPMRVRKTCCATSVESTARDAHDRDDQVIVIQDACAARSDEDHGHALKNLAAIATVTSVDGLRHGQAVAP